MSWLNLLLLCCAVLIYDTKSAKQANFLFILADDQALLFNETSREYMPNLNKYIIDEGISFSNAFISTPVCCPSRTETISGRNYQNIGAPNGTCFMIDAKGNVFNNPSSMFQIFQLNGYSTATFGKLTNDQSDYWCNNKPIINGFDRINCPCKFNNFYGLQYYDLYPNGTQKFYNLTKTAESYETSVVGNFTLEWLQDLTINYKNKPFIGWIGPHSPHLPATPASWNANKFNELKAPRTPNYNLHVYNHHGFASTNPSFNTSDQEWIDQIFRDRVRSMISVDELIGDIFEFLDKNNLLNTTYILYSSDHGFHLGQWRIPTNKYQLYETDIRIPMFLTGPGIKKNKINNNIVGNIDILPTFLDIAGIKYNDNTYDGISWYNSLFNDEEWNRTTYLTQYRYILDAYHNETTQDFHNTGVWYPGNDGSTFPGRTLHPPCCNSDNEAWLTDDISTDNWRAIRILNETLNIIYAEFVDFAWNENAFKNPIFYEYYNVKDDPYQIDNIYDSLSDTQKNQFHDMLMQYGACKGVNCR